MKRDFTQHFETPPAGRVSPVTTDEQGGPSLVTEAESKPTATEAAAEVIHAKPSGSTPNEYRVAERIDLEHVAELIGDSASAEGVERAKVIHAEPEGAIADIEAKAAVKVVVAEGEIVEAVATKIIPAKTAIEIPTEPAAVISEPAIPTTAEAAVSPRSIRYRITGQHRQSDE